ncbi:MAG: hypothetical protein GTN39_05580 [Candidatus Aenigmarchaeota archaeon]|nr:hypothetical protein [Candidatus Aenigmarchaeota archaeon]
MVCYAVPLAATILLAIRRRISIKKTKEGLWLNLLLLGGSLFGAIDHFWNGELFLIGANWVADLSLGVTITLGTFAVWGIIVFRNNPSKLRILSRRAGFYRRAD